MKIYSFIRTQRIPADLEEVWNFFSSPSNLGIITPSKMNFRIVHNSDTSGISQGQIIRYKISVIPFLTTHWTTEISQVDRPNSFTDVQRKGP
jgi:ligand-binding SRPBCC domain-containing protein